MEFNSRGVKHSRAHNFVLKPRNEQHVRERFLGERTEPRYCFWLYLLFRRPIRGIISGSLLPLLPPLIMDGLHLNNKRLDPIDSYIRAPTRFVSKFNAPANLFKLKFKLPSVSLPRVRGMDYLLYPEVYDEDEDFSNLLIRNWIFLPSQRNEEHQYVCQLPGATRLIVEWKQRNAHAAGMHLVTVMVRSRAPRRRKSRALVWMHPRQDPS